MQKLKHWLQLQKGLHGFFVVEVTDITGMFADNEDFSIDRVKSTYERYQFPTKEEAIKDFENWAGDNWEGVARRW